MEAAVSNRSAGRSLLRGTATALALLIVVAIAGPGQAFAASDGETRVIDDKWVMSIGGYLVDFNTTAGVGSGSIIGTIIRLEDELGLDSNKAFARGDGIYRFNSRHAIGYGFWTLNREGQNTFAGNIDWQGIIYDASLGLDTTFDVSWLRADWRYSFLRSDRGEAGFNLGFSFYDLSTSIKGTGTIGMQTDTFEGEEAIALPIPTFGLFINFAITPNVLFKSSFNWLNLDVGDIQGKVSDLSLLFEWYFSKHVGIGGGASSSAIDYRDTGKNPVSIDYKQTGFLGYFTFAWGDVN